MAKVKRSFVCADCGYQAPKWLGQCPECKQWGSLNEKIAAPRNARAAQREPMVATYASIEPTAHLRFSSGSKELDRVLGGGFVRGSLLLLGGDPGIGKSTLMLQVAAHMQSQSRQVLYLSGEESLAQIKLRGERLNIEAPDLNLMAETSFETLAMALEDRKVDVLMIDSIQTLYTGEVTSGPGSITQVREVTAKLLALCKTRDMTTILIGHITKEGHIAGPKTLEHMVDGVFYFEGDAYNQLRMIRAQKNRFGPAQELGIFQMTAKGLVEVANPSQLLLDQRPDACAGSVVVPCIEGTRPLMVEIQVLLSTSTYASPRRVAMGVDANRLALIMAVLEKKAGVQLAGLDIFVNVVGGLSIGEPALDLALALAVYSSFRGLAFHPHLAIFGELGLAGEVRAVNQPERRLKECQNLGFSRIIGPKNIADLAQGDQKVIPVAHLADALEAAL